MCSPHPGVAHNIVLKYTQQLYVLEVSIEHPLITNTAQLSLTQPAEAIMFPEIVSHSLKYVTMRRWGAARGIE